MHIELWNKENKISKRDIFNGTPFSYANKIHQGIIQKTNEIIRFIACTFWLLILLAWFALPF
jgi:hypothetical protein